MQQQPQLAQGENKQYHRAQEGWNICSRHKTWSSTVYLLQPFKGMSGRAGAREHLINEKALTINFFWFFSERHLQQSFSLQLLWNNWFELKTSSFFPSLLHINAILFILKKKKKGGATKRTTLPTAKPPTALEYCAKNLQNVWADFNYSFQRFAIPTTQPIVCFH